MLANSFQQHTSRKLYVGVLALSRRLPPGGGYSCHYSYNKRVLIGTIYSKRFVPAPYGMVGAVESGLDCCLDPNQLF